MLAWQLGSQVSTVECKWKESKAKVPVAFAKAYPEANFSIVNKDNYIDWITSSQHI